jgi:hypothetical protein
MIFFEGGLNMVKLKGIISSCSYELLNAKQLFFEDEQSFLTLIDSIDTIRAASCLMSKDRWKILSSILKGLSTHYNTKYFVYENHLGLFFDVRDEHIYAKSDSELLQLKNEREQIENEVADLQVKHIEINQRIKKLNSLETFHTMSVFIGEE